MNTHLTLKALSDETRMKIVILLLKNNYCVRALAKELKISEAAVSQHLKVLREAGLLTGEKKGYFMHYNVNQNILHRLAVEIDTLANTKREEKQSLEANGCKAAAATTCHNEEKKLCSEEIKKFCHGDNGHAKQDCCKFYHK